MSKPIVQLKEYDPEWALQYEAEKSKMNNIIGDQIIAIEHIRSTSINGLGAKPIVDIMVGVSDLDVTDKLINHLSKIGYEYVPKPEFINRKFFRKGLWGQGICHLHICEFASNEWNEKVLFRDYLRKHSETANEYYLLKKEIAVKYQFDRPAYTKEKEPFIRSVIEKAKREGQ